MTKTNDMPAFPSHMVNDYGVLQTSKPGMTLRDYFAIHADHEELVKILLKNPNLEVLSWQGLRYQYADAMLLQREAEDGKT